MPRSSEFDETDRHIDKCQSKVESMKVKAGVGTCYRDPTEEQHQREGGCPEKSSLKKRLVEQSLEELY